MKNTSNRKALVAICAILGLFAAACGSDGESAGGDGDGIRIAIVAPSAENDLAFTQSIVDGTNNLTGVKEIARSPGLFLVDDAAAALRDYADDGFDLVIGHGSQYGAVIQEIAPDFPDTAFAWGTASDTFGLPNVSAYTAAADQGGYALGALAATKGSTIGIVGPVEVGDAKLYIDGFTMGAEAGGAAVATSYIDSFSDVQLASETASAFADSGVEVMTGTAQMTVGAIGVAEETGLAWFGTQSNQASAAADGVVVASQVYKWEVALQGLVDDIAAGSLGGQSYEINLANGGLAIEWGVGTENGDDQAILDAAIDDIIAGNITTR